MQKFHLHCKFFQSLHPKSHLFLGPLQEWHQFVLKNSLHDQHKFTFYLLFLMLYENWNFGENAKRSINWHE